MGFNELKILAYIVVTLISVITTDITAMPSESEREIIKGHVTDAYLLLSKAYEESSKENRGDLIQKALNEIGKKRFNGNDYLFVLDDKAKIVLHPIKPVLNGKDLSSLQDPTGKFIFKEFVAVASKGREGFVTYYWPKSGLNSPVEKLSFVKGHAPTGLIIGAGMYVKESESYLANEKFGVAVALLELYKTKYGSYPHAITDLSKLGEWTLVKMEGVKYSTSEGKYDLYLSSELGEFRVPSKFATGTGLRSTNATFTHNQ